MKRIVVISDLQVPFHDEKAVKNVAAFIRKWRPDNVLCVGDELDFQTISRWSSGRDEWSGTIGRDRDVAQRVLYQLEVDHIVRSNHTDRLYKSLATRLPGLIGLPELEYENFMGFKQLEIAFHRKPYEISKDWIMVHGDEQSINQNAGLTALGAARRHGKSVVCGHTHRLGVSGFSEASGGVLGRVLRGLEVGHMMDEKQAFYTKGTFNWQKGFGILYVDKKGTTPVAVPIDKQGSFVVEGKRYG
jgi:predicted phosphodiesterase